MIVSQDVMRDSYKGMFVRTDDGVVVRPAHKTDFEMVKQKAKVKNEKGEEVDGEIEVEQAKKGLNLGTPKQTGGGHSSECYSPQAMMKDLDNEKALIVQNGVYVEKYTF